ncbi:hypothetical protein [Streptomyces violascens]|uniref:hypothetical protein n=1 Tax=Streptomyces violascens TaxID=67381 RepID=UPI0036939A24
MDVMITTPARNAITGHDLSDARTILDEGGVALAYGVLCPATSYYSLITLDGRWVIPGTEGYKTRGALTTYARKYAETLRPAGMRILEPVRHNGRYAVTRYGQRRSGICGGQLNTAQRGTGFECSCGASVSLDAVFRDGWTIVGDGRKGTHAVAYALYRTDRVEFGAEPAAYDAPVITGAPVMDAPAPVADVEPVVDAPAVVEPFVWAESGRAQYSGKRYRVTVDGRWVFRVDVSTPDRSGGQSYTAPVQTWQGVDGQWYAGEQIAQFMTYSREACEADITAYVDTIKAREARVAELRAAGGVPKVSEYRQTCPACRIKGKRRCTCGTPVMRGHEIRSDIERLFKAVREERPYAGMPTRKAFAPAVSSDGVYAPGVMLTWEIEGVTFTGQVWANDVLLSAWVPGSYGGTATAVVLVTVDGRAATAEERAVCVPLYTGSKHGTRYAHVSQIWTYSVADQSPNRYRADVTVIAPECAADGLFDLDETVDAAPVADVVAPVEAPAAPVEVPSWHARVTPVASTVADRSWWHGAYGQWDTATVGRKGVPARMVKAARHMEAHGWTVALRAGSVEFAPDVVTGVWELEATAHVCDSHQGDLGLAVLSLVWTQGDGAKRWTYDADRSGAEIAGRGLSAYVSVEDMERAAVQARPVSADVVAERERAEAERAEAAEHAERERLAAERAEYVAVVAEYAREYEGADTERAEAFGAWVADGETLWLGDYWEAWRIWVALDAPAPVEAAPAPVVAPDVATVTDPLDVWEGDGGAVPGVETPAAVPPTAGPAAPGDVLDGGMAKPGAAVLVAVGGGVPTAGARVVGGCRVACRRGGRWVFVQVTARDRAPRDRARDRGRDSSSGTFGGRGPPYRSGPAGPGSEQGQSQNLTGPHQRREAPPSNRPPPLPEGRRPHDSGMPLRTHPTRRPDVGRCRHDRPRTRSPHD